MKQHDLFHLNQFRQKRRLVILGCFFLIGFLLLLVRLYDEQIRRGEQHRERKVARLNRVGADYVKKPRAAVGVMEVFNLCKP